MPELSFWNCWCTMREYNVFAPTSQPVVQRLAAGCRFLRFSRREADARSVPARHGRRRWAILFRRGTMTPQPNARQNTRIRDRRRFGAAPTRGSFRCRGRFDAPSWTGRRIILGIGAMSVPVKGFGCRPRGGRRREFGGRRPKASKGGGEDIASIVAYVN